MRPRNSRIKQAYLDKLEERESWHKLVVKIISWKDGSLREISKITSKEWVTYYHRVLKTNIVLGRQKTRRNLNETKEIIKNNDGFE